jgi:hypothetical protein
VCVDCLFFKVSGSCGHVCTTVSKETYYRVKRDLLL